MLQPELIRSLCCAFPAQPPLAIGRRIRTPRSAPCHLHRFSSRLAAEAPFWYDVVRCSWARVQDASRDLLYKTRHVGSRPPTSAPCAELGARKMSSKAPRGAHGVSLLGRGSRRETVQTAWCVAVRRKLPPSARDGGWWGREAGVHKRGMAAIRAAAQDMLIWGDRSTNIGIISDVSSEHMDLLICWGRVLKRVRSMARLLRLTCHHARACGGRRCSSASKARRRWAQPRDFSCGGDAPCNRCAIACILMHRCGRPAAAQRCFARPMGRRSPDVVSGAHNIARAHWGRRSPCGRRNS